MKILNGINEEFSIKDDCLLRVFKGDKRVVIPKCVNSIGNVTEVYDLDLFDEEDKIFLNSNMEELELLNTVKVLGNNMLDGCRKVKKISFSDSIEQIGKCAFVIDKKIKIDIASDDLVDYMYCTKLPNKFVINYSSYGSLDSLVNKMIDSGSFNFERGNVPSFEFTLVGPKLKKQEKLKLFKKFFSIRVNSVKYVDVVEKNDNINSLIECLNIINNKNMPLEDVNNNLDVSKLKHGEYVKFKLREFNKIIGKLNLSYEEEREYRDYLILTIKDGLKKLGNNEYNKNELLERILIVNSELLDRLSYNPLKKNRKR